MDTPTDRRYSKEHEWALVEADGTILVGISDFAQEQLGDVVFVELPKVGTKLAQNDHIGEIESVKSVSDLFTPVSGEIVAVNNSIMDAPHLVNEDPYKKGWMIRIKADNPAEVDGLLEASAYDALTAS